MSDKSVLANRYAQAVLEAMVDRWQEALMQVMARLQENPGLATMLEDDTVSTGDKMAAVEKLLPAGLSLEMTNLVKLLTQEGKIDLMPDVVGALAKTVTGKSGPVQAEIVSAQELSAADQEQIRNRLLAQYGQDLVFGFQVDPSLMGGLRVRVGDRLIDTSVASRLATLRDSLRMTAR